MLKYIYNGILLQEVPNEISIGITILGCNHHCKGCHSAEYWDVNVNHNLGEFFTPSNVLNLLENKALLDFENASCICFFGGDWEFDTFINTVRALKGVLRYKFAWYTGLEFINICKLNVIDVFDYIKVGEYQEDRGPINKKSTNQRMFVRKFEDITYLMQKDNTNGNVSK